MPRALEGPGTWWAEVLGEDLSWSREDQGVSGVEEAWAQLREVLAVALARM